MKDGVDNLTGKIVKLDKKAFEKLFFDYYDYLYGFAYRYLSNKEEAEELVSDVFLTIWRKRDSLAHIRNLKVYLYVTVKNQAINRIKKRGKTSFLSINNVPVDVVDPAETPETYLLTKELSQAIDHAIERLPARCKVIFQLVRVDGLRYKEVAEILGISAKTVENQVGIATQKISKKITHHFQGKQQSAEWGKRALQIIGILGLFS